ncbi:hypothetical protein KEM55_004417 [Ascosphaera atra]|nr:hypothetical protein KEM55_004417 [Ascosphaera atra]
MPRLTSLSRKTPAQHKSQAAEKSEAAHATGAESPSSPTINTEWIPAHHIQRPEAKRVKNTGRKTRG